MVGSETTLRRATILLAEDDPGDQELTRRALGIRHLDHTLLGTQGSAITHLAAAFRVEGGFVDDHLDFIATCRCVPAFAIDQQHSNHRGCDQLGVTEKAGRPIRSQSTVNLRNAFAATPFQAARARSRWTNMAASKPC